MRSGFGATALGTNLGWAHRRNRRVAHLLGLDARRYAVTPGLAASAASNNPGELGNTFLAARGGALPRGLVLTEGVESE